jgi:hypothetical protein
LRFAWAVAGAGLRFDSRRPTTWRPAVRLLIWPSHAPLLPATVEFVLSFWAKSLLDPANANALQHEMLDRRASDTELGTSNVTTDLTTDPLRAPGGLAA